MRRGGLAASIAAVSNSALLAVVGIKHLVPLNDSLRSGVSALYAAYSALGLPPPQLPPEFLPSMDEPDPEPRSGIRTVVKPLKQKQPEPEECWDPEPVLEASRCRALLLEVVRRAIHDWVLYRQHERLELKQLAHDAYIWLFEEDLGHPNWEERKRADFEVEDSDPPLKVVGARQLTSFLSICDVVGMSPEVVRDRARKMTVKAIMHAGRPAEHRKLQRDDVTIPYEYDVSVAYDSGDTSSYRGGVSPDDYVPHTPDYL